MLVSYWEWPGDEEDSNQPPPPAPPAVLRGWSMYRALAEGLAGHCFINAKHCSGQDRGLLLPVKEKGAAATPHLSCLRCLSSCSFSWLNWGANGAVRAQTPLHAIHSQRKVKYLEVTIFILPQLSIITTISLHHRFQMKNFEGNRTLQVFRADPWKVT